MSVTATISTPMERQVTLTMPETEAAKLKAFLGRCNAGHFDEIYRAIAKLEGVKHFELLDAESRVAPTFYLNSCKFI